jgi:3-isopropylmalate/(R)-2-methylmalate dehydratase small subunit
MIVKAKAVKFGNNVDTDVILPGKYLALTEPEELKEHVMEGISPGFAPKFAEGAIVVAGENFGQGSSREHAPIALKAAGVRCVVAESFARIFYRNSMNIGLPALECPGVSTRVIDGDQLSIDIERGEIKNLRTGETLRTEVIPPNLLQVLNDGGIMEHLRKKRAHR